MDGPRPCRLIPTTYRLLLRLDAYTREKATSVMVGQWYSFDQPLEIPMSRLVPSGISLRYENLLAQWRLATNARKRARTHSAFRTGSEYQIGGTAGDTSSYPRRPMRFRKRRTF